MGGTSSQELLCSGAGGTAADKRAMFHIQHCNFFSKRICIPQEPTSEMVDPDVKKQQDGRSKEAARRRLVAVGHKMKRAFISA